MDKKAYEKVKLQIQQAIALRDRAEKLQKCIDDIHGKKPVEILLKPGSCAISFSGNEETEFITTSDDVRRIISAAIQAAILSDAAAAEQKFLELGFPKAGE